MLDQYRLYGFLMDKVGVIWILGWGFVEELLGFLVWLSGVSNVVRFFFFWGGGVGVSDLAAIYGG